MGGQLMSVAKEKVAMRILREKLLQEAEDDWRITWELPVYR